MLPQTAAPAMPAPHHAKKTAMREALMKMLAQGGQKAPAAPMVPQMPPMAGAPR